MQEDTGAASATIERDDRPLDIRVEGPADDDAEIHVETETVASGEQQGGEEYVTRQEFLRVSAGTHTLLRNLADAVHKLGAVVSVREIVSRLAQTAKEEPVDGEVHGDCGHEERYRPVAGTVAGLNEEYQKRTRGPSVVSSNATAYVITLFSGRRETVESYSSPYVDGSILGQPTLVVGKALFAVHSVESVMPVTDSITGSEPPSDPKEILSVLRAADDDGPSGYNPLDYPRQRFSETAEAVHLFDQILTLAAITPEQRCRMRRIVSRGVSPDQPGGY